MVLKVYSFFSTEDLVAWSPDSVQQHGLEVSEAVSLKVEDKDVRATSQKIWKRYQTRGKVE